jgi:hypothetical protein
MCGNWRRPRPENYGLAAGNTNMAQLPGINKVNWHQVGNIAEPGRYLYTFGWLTVRAEDISIWEQYPNAVFTLVSARTEEDSSTEEYRLGTFELR